MGLGLGLRLGLGLGLGLTRRTKDNKERKKPGNRLQTTEREPRNNTDETHCPVPK